MKNIVKSTLLSLCLLICGTSFSQSKGLIMRLLSADQIEQPPTFQGGGLNMFANWVISEFGVPGTAIANGVQGNIVLSCIIDAEGQLVDPKIVKGLDTSLDNELLRVFSISPKWDPAKDKGASVNVNYTFMVSCSFRKDTTIKNDEFYSVILKEPRFQGGDTQDFCVWVRSRLQYPEKAMKQRVEGTVSLQFTVDVDGSVVDVNVLKGLDSLLDKEAVRVVSSSPKWEPAINYDKPVKVKYNLPITFQANKEQSQNYNMKIIQDEIPYDVVERKPTFQGKDANEFTKWVHSKIKYPEQARKQKIQGRVILSFVLDEEGGIVDINVLNGADSLLCKEAIRVVSSSPKWEPGIQDNKYVKVRYLFPVEFKLRGVEQKIVPSSPKIEVLPTFKDEDPYERFVKYVQWNTRYPMKEAMAKAVVPFKKSGALVLLGFVVSKDGRIEDIKIIKSSGREDYDKAAMNVVKKSPKWNPGMDKGVPVDVEYSIMIEFRDGYTYATFI